MALLDNAPSRSARLRSFRGQILDLNGDRWMGPADDADLDVLSHAVSPVLDIGCGPGRHTEALKKQGMTVLGIDLSAHAVELARARRLPVMEGSVFHEIPASGMWASALLLDGNIGMGADPLRLLQRTARLLSPDGRILIETEELCEPGEAETVRLEIAEEAGPWFMWTRVDVSTLVAMAPRAGLHPLRTWQAHKRWFVLLEKDNEAR